MVHLGLFADSCLVSLRFPPQDWNTLWRCREAGQRTHVEHESAVQGGSQCPVPPRSVLAIFLTPARNLRSAFGLRLASPASFLSASSGTARHFSRQTETVSKSIEFGALTARDWPCSTGRQAGSSRLFCNSQLHFPAVDVPESRPVCHGSVGRQTPSVSGSPPGTVQRGCHQDTRNLQDKF